jgi:hypothetical protein
MTETRKVSKKQRLKGGINERISRESEGKENIEYSENIGKKQRRKSREKFSLL